MVLIFLGPPGVGKGTQAARVSSYFEVPKISTGDILREAVSKKTTLGVLAKSFMEAGQLVTDDIVIGLIRERIQEPDCAKGYFLDGFPRNVPQAEALTQLFKDTGSKLDRVLSFELSDAELVKRLSSRRSCPQCKAVYNVMFQPPKKDNVCDQCESALIQRGDDEPETIKERLKVYQRETEPLIPYYERQGVLARIDAVGTVENVFSRIKSSLSEIVS